MKRSDADRSRRGAGGFTLVEVLVSLSILAMIGVGATALGFSGVLAIRDSTADATQGAVASQLAQMVFARDVQGSTAVVDACKRPRVRPCWSGWPCRVRAAPSSTATSHRTR